MSFEKEMQQMNHRMMKARVVEAEADSRKALDNRDFNKEVNKLILDRLGLELERSRIEMGTAIAQKTHIDAAIAITKLPKLDGKGN